MVVQKPHLPSTGGAILVTIRVCTTEEKNGRSEDHLVYSHVPAGAMRGLSNM